MKNLFVKHYANRGHRTLDPNLPAGFRCRPSRAFCLVATLLVASLAFDAYAQRGRAYVDNGTVRSDQGTLLRGPFIKLWNRTLYPIDSDDAELYSADYWRAFKDTGYNSVRIAVAWGTRSYPDFSPETTLQALDELVAVLTSLGMYVTICGSAHDYAYYYKDDLQEAWNNIAPRYAGNPNVLYEIQNEPMGDPNGFHSNPPSPKGNAYDLVEIYHSVRDMAPNTVIGMWGFSALGDDTNSALWAIKKHDRNQTISYDKTAVAFHYYPPTESAYVNKLQGTYPVWMTEGSDEGPGGYLNRDFAWYADCEAKGISWYFMDFQDMREKGQQIKTYLSNHGYDWVPDAASGTSRGVFFESEALSSSQSAQLATDLLSHDQASGGQAVILPSSRIGQWVEFSLPNIAAGTYRVRAHVLRHPSFGTFQMSIGGTKVGSQVNTFGDTSLLTASQLGTGSSRVEGPSSNFGDEAIFTFVDVATVSFSSSGEKKFRFTVAGRDPASNGYNLAIDAIELVR